MLCRLFDLSPAPSSQKDFSDTRQHWARTYIRTAQYHGLVSGVGGNRYAPDSPVSRQEMAVMLDQALSLNVSVPSRSPFPDVSRQETPWSYQAILRLYQAGILSGFDDGTFRPAARLSRAELAAMLYNIETS